MSLGSRVRLLVLIAGLVSLTAASTCDDGADDCAAAAAESSMVLLQNAHQVVSHSAARTAGIGVQTAPPVPRAKVLLLVTSCHKHADDWDRLRDWAQEVHPEGAVLILSGVSPDMQSLGHPYEVSLSSSTLMVNASDTYEALPEKMMMAYNAVNEAPELQHITHVFKVDDTSILQTDPSDRLEKPRFWYDMNASLMEASLDAEAGSYLIPEAGYIITNCTAEECIYDYHQLKVKDPDSYWYDRAFNYQGPPFAFADGQRGYMLSRRAISILASAWPVSAMDRLRHTFVLEDMAVGLTLFQGGVEAVPIKLAGLPYKQCSTPRDPWGHLECPRPDYQRCCWYCEDTQDSPLCRDVTNL